MLVAALALLVAAAPATAAPGGPTAIALDSAVELAWQPVSGASGYAVYRGTTQSAMSQLLTPAEGVASTTYTDGAVANGTTYYYSVKPIVDGIETGASSTVSATPQARTCAGTNPVAVENCYPGSTGWKLSNTLTVAAGGIEGYATAQSIDNGESVDLKVKSAAGSTFRVEIYRVGYYGGSGGRLVSVIQSIPGTAQPACFYQSTTGLTDCAAWSVSATVTTTDSWTSGVYLLKLIREDTGADNEILLAVRDDARDAEILYGVGFTTYQAYNNYGGKSLYDFNSSSSITVSGKRRAVKASFDRPYEQSRSGHRDWFTKSDIALVIWLEREGYDVSYQSNTDLEHTPAEVLDHTVYVLPAHDEYYGAGMRAALDQARDAGISLFSSGSNEVYWKVRFEPSPVSATAERVMVTYKTSQTGVADPSGIFTGLWRDPAVGQPEDALLGQMYIGDQATKFYPLTVSALEGTDRVYRYTGLDTKNPGTQTKIGKYLVGWEWNARQTTGAEPPGVKTLATSSVTGNVLQPNFAYATQTTNSNVTKYVAASGALVFATGTNHWSRGLVTNPSTSVGEPSLIIQQTTVNVLSDMGVAPATPSAGIRLDNFSIAIPAPTGVTAQPDSADSVTVSWDPVFGATGYNVYRLTAPRDGGLPLGVLLTSAPIAGGSFVDTGLSAGTTYYYAVSAVSGSFESFLSSDAPATVSIPLAPIIRINTGGGAYTTLSGVSFIADAYYSGGSTKSVSSTISGTNDQTLYKNERYGVYTYSIPVGAGAYDVRFHFAELVWGVTQPGGAGKRVFSIDILDSPGSPDLQNIDIYSQVGANAALFKTVRDVVVTDGFLDIVTIKQIDNPELAALEVIPVPSVPPAVTSQVPAPGGTQVNPSSSVTATFSRSLDPATVNTSSFTLTAADGTSVPASVSYDATAKKATLVPLEPLAIATTYTAHLGTTIESADGIPISAPVSWSFTTATFWSPTVTVTAPAASATLVSRATVVTATFSRAMNASTITPASFRLSGPSGPVATTVTYDSATLTAVLDPVSDLSFSTAYTATIDTTITAADGSPLAADVVWTFATEQPPSIDTGAVSAYTATTGRVFLPDQYVSGGTKKSTTSPISGTPDPVLYKTERYGIFTYNIPLPAGTYDVTLHFVELFWGTSQPGAVGKRIFSIDILDTPETPDVSNLDIYAEVGPNAALARTVRVSVTDGYLTVKSIKNVDNPEITAIEVNTVQP